MHRIQVLDTFPRFLRTWPGLRNQSRRKQLDGWAHAYLGPWPDLLVQQIDNYRRDGVSWRSVAQRRILPTLDGRIAAMERVHAHLVREIPWAVRRIDSLLEIDFRIRCVIYVGIGCGAGWATTFRGSPAILFGLENAAELDWSDSATVRAMIAHELAHLVHYRRREQAGLAPVGPARSPWWNLYDEGFATRCEMSLGSIGKSHSVDRDRDWLRWCQANRRWLARAFLRTVEARRSTRRFFGSWYPLRGHIETGYFLGSEVVRDWERSTSLRSIEILELPQIRRYARFSLERMAG
ncbi:MAG: hypothetical protein WA549_10040 [Thermoplasmata archaeon]